MKLESTIDTELEKSMVRELLSAHFAVAGYRQVVAQPNLMIYQRGKFLTFSAKGCKVDAVIHFSPGPDQVLRVSVTLDIDTSGQFIIERERVFWRKELDDIAQTILGNS